MSNSGIEVTFSGKLAIIRLNRPKVKNAMHRDTYIELAKTLNEISNNTTTTITAITGTGDFYSSGNDISSVMEEMTSDAPPSTVNPIDRVKNLVAAFINHQKILVAVLNGPAIGIAATTLALCDIVYAQESAYLSTPFTRLALCCEGCSSYTFPKIFGPSKASEILLFNKKITAKEAFDCGFIAKIYSKQQIESILWPELQKNADELSATSLIVSKKLLRLFDKEILHKSNEQECAELNQLYNSEDAINAVLQFVSKRQSKL